MILVADIGNSRIKWAIATGSGLADAGQSTHGGSVGPEFESIAKAVPARIDGVMAVNVAGSDIESAFTAFARRRWGVEPRFAATAREAHGVRCAYRDPSRMGADRWVALIGAFKLAGGAACVVDAGTAVTLDAVNARGRHLGGLILAGPEVIAGALDRQTSGIGETRGRPKPGRGIGLLGASTDEAVAKGAMLGLAGALDKALGAVAAELDAPPASYITGGDARRLSPWLESQPEFRPHLVLEGLAAMAGALELGPSPAK